MLCATKLVTCAAVCIWGLQPSALLSAAPTDVGKRSADVVFASVAPIVIERENPDSKMTVKRRERRGIY